MKMNKRTIFLIMFLILLIVPFVSSLSASTDSYSVDSYHTGSSGSEPNTTSYSSRSTTTYQQGGNSNGTTTSYSFNAGWFEAVSVSVEEVFTTTPTGGGGGGGFVPECTQNLDCAENQYCFQNSCFDAECSDDSACKVEEGEVCWNLRCVKLFDIKILNFESPIMLGEFFDFTYFVKGVADINRDVEINFRIEKNGSIVSSGTDVIYFGSFEEKTETTSLFLPSNIKSGTYEFIIQVGLGTYVAESRRTIEISVSKGVATLELFDITFSLDNSLIQNSDELSAVVTFESFGTEPTGVDLTFIILDEIGNEIYTEEDSVIVETEKLLRKSFEGLNLPRGKYTIVLQTLYSVDVFDEFKQEFEVGPEGISGITGNAINFIRSGGSLLAGVIGLFVLGGLVWWLIRKRKRRKEEKQRKKVKIYEKSLFTKKGTIIKIIDKKFRRRKIFEKLKHYREIRRRKGELRKLQKRGEKGKRIREKNKRVRLRKDEAMKKAENVRRSKLYKEKLKEDVRKKKQKELWEQERIRISGIKEKIEGLERKKALLKKGYQAGYINEKAYQMDMKKLEKLISRFQEF